MVGQPDLQQQVDDMIAALSTLTYQVKQGTARESRAQEKREIAAVRGVFRAADLPQPTKTQAKRCLPW